MLTQRLTQWFSGTVAVVGSGISAATAFTTTLGTITATCAVGGLWVLIRTLRRTGRQEAMREVRYNRRVGAYEYYTRLRLRGVNIPNDLVPIQPSEDSDDD